MEAEVAKIAWEVTDKTHEMCKSTGGFAVPLLTACPAPAGQKRKRSNAQVPYSTYSKRGIYKCLHPCVRVHLQVLVARPAYILLNLV